jgi:actin-related protein
MHGAGSRKYYVGEQAELQRGMLSMSYPVSQGAVQNWDDWEQLVRGMYEKLKSAPSEQPVLFSVPIQSPLANEQKIAEILFETFSVPTVGGVLAPALSLYASGKDSGVVIEIGDGATQIVPIYQSQIIDEAIIRTNVAGRAMTNYMAKLMTERSSDFTSPSNTELSYGIERLKRECSYVALNFESEMAEYVSTPTKYLEYTMANGATHRIASERIRVGELLFQPKLGGYETPGLHQMVWKALQKCPMDTRAELYSNILLSGGVTLTSGLAERLSKEISASLPSSMICNVVAPDNRWHSAWEGGAVVGPLSSDPSYGPNFMTKAMYEEFGACAIHRYGCLITHPSQIAKRSADSSFVSNWP